MHVIWGQFIVSHKSQFKMQTQQTTPFPVLKKREVSSLAILASRTNPNEKQDTITTSGTTCGFRRHQR